MKISIEGRLRDQPKTRPELTALLCEVLDFDELPRELWGFLFQESHVNGALYPPSVPGVRACVKAARQFLKKNPTLQPQERARRSTPPVIVGRPQVTEEDLGFAQYFSERVAELARNEAGVRQLRSQVLTGTLLSLEDAKAMLLCTACRFMSPSEFREGKIPVVGHQSEDRDVRGPDEVFTNAVHIEWADRSTDIPVPDSLWRESNPQSPAIGSYGQTIRIPVAPWSVLDEIRRVADGLSGSYPWEPVEATLFLLTDNTPLIRPINVVLRSRSSLEYNFGRITMEIQPWVSVDTVRRTYQSLRQQNFHPFPTSCDPATLRMYHFTAQRRAANPGLTWHESMMDWKNTKPEPKPPYTGYAEFRRAYVRAESWLKKHPFTAPIMVKPDEWLTMTRKRKGKRKPLPPWGALVKLDR